MLAVSSRRVLPGFTLSLGTSLLFVCLILLLPLSALVMQLSQMSWSQYWDVVTNPQVVAAYKVTLLAAFVASIFNGVFGLLMAWILTRYRFPGRTLLDALMDLPFALPTAVAGLTLASLFSVNGFYGQFLAQFDIKVTYTWLGIAVAMAFTSIPFVVRTVQPVLEELGPEYEEAAQTLGATRLQSFRKVVLPELSPALIAGVALSFTRSENVNTLEQTIGNTPLVKLQRLGPDNGSEIWVKLEGNNPAGSVKDRAALSMIVEAEKRGEIKPGDVLIEATSGNTGIALAMIAALKGYRMKLLMPDNMSQERRAAMRAYGAELILVTKEQGMEGARDLALAMSERGEGKLLDQFNNPDNPYAHYTTTGPEIWRQTSGRITHFVSSMGTTGTITGVSRFLREQEKPVTIVGLQPEEGSSIPGIRRWPAEYMPGIFNASLVDEVLDIHQNDAENTMRELAVREGIFCGVSSGGAVAGALRVARATPGAVVVAIICDRGDRYLSTGVFGEEHFSQGAGI
ncbi:cysteine synthase CysM [Salmonella enterica subsp. enterica serovar Newport]|nr:cysteine synthase CysM [Salmonella enterica subsp. enterica serovar Newport]EGC2931760.1 cysteine synthase CysM [Salmonella enterica subsp. enterica serovar Newport]